MACHGSHIPPGLNMKSFLLFLFKLLNLNILHSD